MKNITVSIPDMQSTHCQSRVSNAVRGIEGVQLQDVKAGKLTASIASDSIKKEVENAIVKAGYNVLSVEDSSESNRSPDAATSQFIH